MPELAWFAAGVVVAFAAVWLRRRGATNAVLARPAARGDRTDRRAVRDAGRAVAATSSPVAALAPAADSPPASASATATLPAPGAATTPGAAAAPDPAPAPTTVPPTALAEPPPAETQPAPAAAAAAAPATPDAPCLEQARRATADCRQLALSLADELANLVSGVEGRVHHLIEVAPDYPRLPKAAEALLTSVQRLRTLHNKLAAFGHAPRHAGAATTVTTTALVARLREELPTLQLGLELRWDPPQHLPELAVAPDVAHDALLFLCGAMWRAERGASRLTLACETCFASAVPRAQLELALEWSTENHTPSTEVLGDPSFTLDLEAAHQLIAEHGGDLTIHHLPGRSVRALVRWPLATRADANDAAAATPEAGPLAEHRYGGALVLESDPAVRAMLANELKATGRAVFACADNASARTFLEATPERFELLIVDHPGRLDGGDALGPTIRAVAPGLKVFVLAANQPAAGIWPGLHHIQKPFGVHELRHALASVLAGG